MVTGCSSSRGHSSVDNLPFSQRCGRVSDSPQGAHTVMGPVSVGLGARVCRCGGLRDLRWGCHPGPAPGHTPSRAPLGEGGREAGRRSWPRGGSQSCCGPGGALEPPGTAALRFDVSPGRPRRGQHRWPRLPDPQPGAPAHVHCPLPPMPPRLVALPVSAAGAQGRARSGRGLSGLWGSGGCGGSRGLLVWKRPQGSQGLPPAVRPLTGPEQRLLQPF